MNSPSRGAVIAARNRILRPYFKMGQPVGNLSLTFIEFSELTHSCKPANDAYLWAVQDGTTAAITAIDKSTAATAGTWTLTGATPSDTETMTSATVDDVHYVFIGDTGDNGNARATINIYRIKEPTVTGSNGSLAAGTDYETIVCAFPAGNLPSHKDTEAMFCDPDTGDLYIITKRISPVKLYRLPFAASYSGTQTLEYVTDLTSDTAFNTISTTVSGNNGYVTGCCISPNGSEIILRSYSNLYLWRRNKSSETIAQCLARAPDAALTDIYVGGGGGAENTVTTNRKFFHPEGEPQGEAVSFDRQGIHLYTCSEFVTGQADQSGSRRINPLFKYERIGIPYSVASFQQGTNSYAGCEDTFVDQATPDQQNATVTSLVADIDYTTYPTVSRYRCTMMKFDVSAIPTTATVIGAYLELYINTEGKQFALYKMLQSWNSTTVTWNTIGGLTPDGVKASSTADAVYGTAFDSTTGGTGKALDAYVGFCRVNLPLAMVQSWVSNSANNFGFMITGGAREQSGDGVQFDSAEGATVSRRPKLTILYY